MYKFLVTQNWIFMTNIHKSLLNKKTYIDITKISRSQFWSGPRVQSSALFSRDKLYRDRAHISGVFTARSRVGRVMRVTWIQCLFDNSLNVILWVSKGNFSVVWILLSLSVLVCRRLYEHPANMERPVLYIWSELFIEELYIY